MNKHLDDIFKPLFTKIMELMGHLTNLDYFLYTGKTEIREIGPEIRKTKQASSNFAEFVTDNYEELSLYLPAPYPWRFGQLEDLLKTIFQELDNGNYQREEIHKAMRATLTMQNDLKKLLGFTTDVKMESKHPFE